MENHITKIEIKKLSLINHIKNKMDNANELQCEKDRVLKLCKKMSYKALHKWAVMNDFID